MEAGLERCPYLQERVANRSGPTHEIFAGPYGEIAPLVNEGTVKFAPKEIPVRHFVYLGHYHGASQELRKH